MKHQKTHLKKYFNHYKKITLGIFLALWGTESCLANLTGSTHATYFNQTSSNPFYDIKTTFGFNQTFLDIELTIHYQSNDNVPSSFFIPVSDSDIISGKVTGFHNDHTLTIGNFYDAIGHGLIFRSYLDKSVLVDQNIYGTRWQHNGNNHRIKSLYGSIRSSNSSRPATTTGVEAMLYTNKVVGIGFGLANTTFTSTQIEGRSILFELDSNPIQISSELANQATAGGFANYYSVSIPWNQWHYKFEHGKYNNFDLSHSNIYLNQAPIAIKESSFSLPSKQYPTLSMDEYEALQMETNYHHQSHGITSIAYSEKNIGTYYEEIYLEHFQNQLHKLNRITLAYSKQRYLSQTYHSYMGKSNMNLWNKYSFDWRLEYQIISNTNYYKTIQELTYLLSSPLSIGIISEIHSTYLINNQWTSIVVNYQPNTTQLFQLIVGETAPGKVCSGGICIIQAEFSGIIFNIKQEWN